MQDLEELGLVFSPHTSAGRLPTELGLRFFVDSLLQIGDLTEPERSRIEAQIARRLARTQTMEEALSEASLLLSGLTRGAGVVLTTKDNNRLKQVDFVRLEPEKALAILVSEDGSVENRILAGPGRSAAVLALIEAGNYLNARLRGRTLDASARRDRDFARRRPGGAGRPDGAACRRRAGESGPARQARRKISSCAARPICSRT